MGLPSRNVKGQTIVEEKKLIIKKKEGYVGTLTFNRPDKKNALSPELLFMLHEVLEEWAEDESVRSVVITGGHEGVFSSGYDIGTIATHLIPAMTGKGETQNALALALKSLKNFPCPTIAMMNGFAFGAALNLALCCEIRIAADNISAGMPPARLGLVYHADGIKPFIEVLGPTRTREVFLSARTYRGTEVRNMGLVDRLVPPCELADVTYRLAADMAANAPLAVRGMKRIINLFGQCTGIDHAGLEEVEMLIREAFESEDLREGQKAFFEKRKPHFIGR